MEVEFPITYDVWATISTEGLMVHGDGAYVSKVAYKAGAEISENTVWFGEKQCNWGNPVSIPASVFAKVKAGDVLKVWTSEASCQVILGGWSGLNLGVYSAGGIDNMTYEDGVCTVTMIADYAETNTYGDAELDVFALMKANGVVIQGPTTITRVDFEHNPLDYVATGETMSIGGEWGNSGLAGIRDIKIEAYDDNSYIIRGFMGAEGYDVKITLDETTGYAISLASIINGVESAPVTADDDNNYLGMFTGNPDIYYTALFPSASGGDCEAEEGYILMQGYFYRPDGTPTDDFYYYIQWPQTPMFTLGEIKNITDADDPEGNGVIMAKIKVDNAKVTYYDYDEDYQEVIAFIEDESGAAQLWYITPVEGIAQGNSLTGIINAAILTADKTIYVQNFDGEVGTADVKKGLIVTSTDQVKDAANAYRLVTINNSTNTPIVYDPDLGFGLTIGEDVYVTDLFGALDDEYTFPETVLSVTGIVYPYDMSVMNADEEDDDMGLGGGMMYFVLPRSAADIVAKPGIPNKVENAITENGKKAAIFNLAGQKVNANFKGIIVKDGKKVMVK